MHDVDAQPRNAYILGDANTTQVVELHKPAALRCLAGGFPKPIVSWWKGTEILPLRTSRFEVTREYSLVFNSIELTDLGPYICQAYSGEGRPVSSHITVKAIGPVYPNSTEEERYMQYVIEPSSVPIIPTPYYPPYYPRQHTEAPVGKETVIA